MRVTGAADCAALRRPAQCPVGAGRTGLQHRHHACERGSGSSARAGCEDRRGGLDHGARDSIGGLIPDGVRVTIDPKGLAPGTYSDAVAITSNAVAYTGALGDKTSLTVPVDLEIVGAGAPVVDFQGVLDNAIFAPGDAIARGDIVAVKGQQLSMMAPATGTAPPLSTQVADTQVLLNGVPIPLFYTSYGQINCQIPTDAPAGTATLQVKRTDGQASNLVTVEDRGARAAAAAFQYRRLWGDRQWAGRQLSAAGRRDPGRATRIRPRPAIL